MKKIFAIALALVMVLSMASAFAAVGGVQCYTPAYTCPTVGCGVAKAEVVKFVKTNDCFKTYDQSDCAAVVTGLPVFYGVKVIFDKDVNKQWFEDDNTKLTVTRKNFKTAAFDGMQDGVVSAELDKFGVTYAQVADGGIFWLAVDPNGGYKLVKDADFDAAACVFAGTADNTGAKVCANVEYENDGIGTWDYTNFDAKVIGAASGFDFAIELSKAGKTLSILVVDGVAKYASFAAGVTGDWYYADKGVMMVAEGGTYDNAGNVAGGKLGVAANLTCNDIDEYLALIGIKLGDCVTASTIKAIFGWDDKDAAMHCVTWDKNAQAVVNSECVVMGIPKTGDASVLAWLF